MDSQQEIYSALLVALKKNLDCGVYDGYLPSDDTPYPFVYLADSQLIDDYGNKTMVLGTVNQTIHIWHNNFRKRGDVSSIMQEIKAICRSIEHTSSYAWSVSNINQRILTDDSTKVPLMHGILEVDFRIIGGKV